MVPIITEKFKNKIDTISGKFIFDIQSQQLE
jgi:hypothetical protein